MKRIVITLFVGLFLISGCASQDNDLTKVDLLLDYTPNTNHTGLYVAIDKGYFEEVGIDLNIVQPAQSSAEQLVSQQKADFGISYSENVAQFNDANGQSISSIYAILDHNTSGLVARTEKNINSIADLKGKTYCGWGSNVESALLDVLLSQADLSLDDIEIMTTSVDFLNAPDDCDFMWVYEGWDIVNLDLNNISYNYFPFTDYEIDWYTPNIITSDELIQENPQLITDFLTATSKGYKYAKEYPNEAAEIFLASNPEFDEEFITNSQTFLSAHYQKDGYQDPVIWSDFLTFLKEYNVISTELNESEQYTNDFN